MDGVKGYRDAAIESENTLLVFVTLLLFALLVLSIVDTSVVRELVVRSLLTMQ